MSEIKRAARTRRQKRFLMMVLLFAASVCLFASSLLVFHHQKPPVIEHRVEFDLDRYLYPVDEIKYIQSDSILLRFRVWKDIIVEKHVVLDNYDGQLTGAEELLRGKQLFLKTNLQEVNGKLLGSVVVVGLEGGSLGSHLKRTKR